MSEEILVNVTPPETRVAVVENGVVQEIIIERLERNAHTVLHYRLGAGRSMHVESAFAGGIYRRGSGNYSRAGLTWQAETSWGLAEFDSLGYATALMIDLIVNNQRAARRVLVVSR